jgi:hypothetical protein
LKRLHPNESWKRKPRKNGEKAVYVNIPRQFIEALDMPWEKFWNSKIEFRLEDGKAIIELKKPSPS